MDNEEKDTRGYDLRAENFRMQLNNLISNSNLYPSTIYYMLKDTLLQIENLYNQAVDLQYKKFCDENKEQEEETKEDKAE